MWRRALVTAALVVVTLFAVGGHNRYEGPTLFALSHSHGVHAGDIPLVVLAAWAVSLLWGGGRRRPSTGR